MFTFKQLPFHLNPRSNQSRALTKISTEITVAHPEKY